MLRSFEKIETSGHAAAPGDAALALNVSLFVLAVWSFRSAERLSIGIWSIGPFSRFLTDSVGLFQVKMK